MGKSQVEILKEMGLPKELASLMFGTKQVKPALVERSTEEKKIILPSTMSKLEGARELERQFNEEEKVIEYSKEIKGWEWQDVLVAVKVASEKHFGWVNAKDGRWGQKPMFIEVVTDIVDGKEQTTECFYGKSSVTAWENADMDIHISRSADIYLNFNIKKKYIEEVKEFYALVMEQLNTSSIYRGKSVVAKKSRFGGVDYQIIENNPSTQIFFNESQQIVFEDLLEPELLEPGKRVYLFTGSYGTGKTEKAMQLGHLANKNGATFFYVKDSNLLTEMLVLAKNYDPCVLFLEDVDEVTSGQRGTQLNNLLNTIDGIETKTSNTKIIFTTNNENDIHPAFRRPGRIDLIVRFDFPDLKTKAVILDSYLQGLTGYNTINREEMFKLLPDAQGAVIAEIAKRIKRLALRKGEVTERFFKSAIASIEPQLSLMALDKAEKQPDFERVLKDTIKEVVAPMAEELGVLSLVEEV